MSHMSEGTCLRSNEKRTFPASFASHVLASTLAAKQIAVSKQNHNWFSLIRSDPTSSWSQPRPLHREKNKRNTSHSHRRFEMWFSTHQVNTCSINRCILKKCTEAASFFSSSSRSFSNFRHDANHFAIVDVVDLRSKIQADLGDFPIPQEFPHISYIQVPGKALDPTVSTPLFIFFRKFIGYIPIVLGFKPRHYVPPSQNFCMTPSLDITPRHVGHGNARLAHKVSLAATAFRLFQGLHQAAGYRAKG